MGSFENANLLTNNFSCPRCGGWLYSDDDGDIRCLLCSRPVSYRVEAPIYNPNAKKGHEGFGFVKDVVNR